jgi:hypothetical protein
MPFFVGIDPITLQIVDIYEYEEIDRSRLPNAVHIEVLPPLDYRCVNAIKQNDGKIILVPDPILQEQHNVWELNILRTNRNRMLQESDWTQFSTNAITIEKKTQWEAYRQALRDMPSNTSIPRLPQWPVPPA